MIESKKIVLVTGGNRGLGLALCRAFAERGYHVILTARDEQAGREKVDVLTKEGYSVEFCALDVSDERSIRSAIEGLTKSHGRLDVLINNAGVLLDIQEKQIHQKLDETFETNVVGPYLLCELASPLLKKSKSGRIVNVSSHIASLSSMQSDYPSYRISKAALNAVTRIFASLLADDGILVNSICPGWIQTDMGGPHAPLGIENGVESVLFAVDLPNGGPTGKFFQNGKELPW